jgi:hypothetical protein
LNLTGASADLAIESQTGFSLDANIQRPDGTERWIRITAAVRSSDGRAVALYGMKQDITEDHARWEILRSQAECDPLTGVAKRVRFQRFLENPVDEPLLANTGLLMLFDLDGFSKSTTNGVTLRETGALRCSAKDFGNVSASSIDLTNRWRRVRRPAPHDWFTQHDGESSAIADLEAFPSCSVERPATAT